MENQKADVVIIGAGAVGVCSAWFAAQKGLSVTILDRGDVASGSSAGNAGLVGPRYFAPLAAPGVIAKGLKWMFNPESPFYIKPRFDFHLMRWLLQFRKAAKPQPYSRGMSILLDLNRASIRLYQQLSASNGIEFGFSQKGVLLLYNSESGFQDNEAMAETAQKFDLPVEHLDRDQINRMEPGLDCGASGGYFYRQDGHLTPLRFVQQLASQFDNTAGKVQLITNAGDLRLLRNGKKIEAVKAADGEYIGKHYVLAAGGWSAKLARQAGLKLSMEPAKGYSISIPMEKPPTTTPLLLSEAKVAVTPMGSSLRLAGTLELAGTDLSINPRRVAAIRKSVPAYFGNLNDQQIDKGDVWSGLRPCSPDGLPYLGAFRDCQNLLAATGHGMIGMSLAPISGQLIAQIINGEETSVDVAPLAPDRY